MQKSKATKLANIINYLGTGSTQQVWEALVHPRFDIDWMIIVKLNNVAYRHELNALMMAINANLAIGQYQEVDDDGEIVWKLW